MSLHWRQVLLDRSEVSLQYASNPRILPISSSAVALFRELSALYGEEGCVFPSMGYKKSHLSHMQLEQVFIVSGKSRMFSRQTEHLGLAEFIRTSVDWKPALIHFGAIACNETFWRDAYVEEQRNFVEKWSNRLMLLVDALRAQT